MGSKLSDIVSFDGTRLSYRVKEGREPALIFIHGSGSNHSMWIPYFGHFKNKIIAPDLRGHGRSEYGKMTIENCAKDLLEILKKEKVKKAIVVGNSLGTTVALELYKQSPKKIKKLLLNVPFAKKFIRGSWLFLPVVSAICTVIRPLHFKRKLRFQDYSNCRGWPLWYFPLLDIKGTSMNTYFESIKALFKYPFNLKRIKVPTIVVLSKHDLLCKSHEILKQGKKGITFAIVESHHMLAGRDPNKLIAIMKGFI